MSLQWTIDTIAQNTTDANSAVKMLFEELGQPGYDWGEPKKSEFDHVMESIAGWVENETSLKKAMAVAMAGEGGPTSPKTRAQVIRFIHDYIASKQITAF